MCICVMRKKSGDMVVVGRTCQIVGILLFVGKSQISNNNFFSSF
jgi:hypothetical protein